jgi:dolichyl-phosphate beta-glucosyltransferase
MPTPAGTVVVVPCYNEAERLQRETFLAMAGEVDARLLMVDDGSTDGTGRLLAELASASDGRISVLDLPRNRGKAEAVRRGLLVAIEGGAAIVGYLDADLSTPPSEMGRLLETLSTREAQLVMGARVALLGRRVERSPVRHYLGRVFATLVSLILRLPVYDTQCGAKAMRVTPALRAALAQPFLSRWAFDVELIGRLTIGTTTVPAIPVQTIIEVPLEVWCDVKGSKVRLPDMIQALFQLAAINGDLSRRRRRAGLT